MDSHDNVVTLNGVKDLCAAPVHEWETSSLVPRDDTFSLSVNAPSVVAVVLQERDYSINDRLRPKSCRVDGKISGSGGDV